ncbi:hypothetical protein D3C83_238140 [compost metagenome]
MTFEHGEDRIKFFLGFYKEVDVIKRTRKFAGKFQGRRVNRCDDFFWRIHQKCANPFLDT